MIPFVKMHGCGNDFILVRERDLVRNPDAAADAGPDRDDWIVPPGELARRVCDRHFGLGADGLLVYGPRPSRDGMSRLRMFYWNADGSRAAMCGNGARCIVRLACERGEARAPLVLETDAGPRPADVRLEDGRVAAVEIDMGLPAWSPEDVPVRGGVGLVEAPVQVAGEPHAVTALSMGNPHAIVFVGDPAALAATPLESVGRSLSEHALFPQGANASFATVTGAELHVRTWERGSGATLACGTATCAAFAAAQRTGRLVTSKATVHLPGGLVEVERTADGHLWLRGPAEYVAEGTLASGLLVAESGG